MISNVIFIKGAAQLPETLKAVLPGMKLAKVVESRFTRSPHAQDVRILEVLREHGPEAKYALEVLLERPIGEPVVRSKKSDPISFYRPQVR